MSYPEHHMEAGGAKPVAAENLRAEQDRRALQLMLEYARAATRSDVCEVALKHGSAAVMQASVGTTPPPGAALHPAAAIRAECLRTGAVVNCEDTASDPRGIINAEACRRMRIAAVVAAPVRVEGRTVGVLEMHSAQADNFMDGDIEVLQRVADVIAALICRRNST